MTDRRQPTDYSRLLAQWIEATEKELPAAAELRKQIHTDPKIGGQEQSTADMVAGAMELHFHSVADTGGIVRLGPESGPAIALRGELDALPIDEETGVEWASRTGAMHACGHDVHLAALSAVVRASRNLSLPYGLVPFLQPREEVYPSGAQDIKESGMFQDYGVARAIGAHVHPGIPLGSVAAGAGFVNAAAGEIHIDVHGKGGHGAYPHQASDVAACCAQVCTGLQEIVRRTADPMTPALLSIGTIEVGNGAANVLPETGRILATIRTTSRDHAADLVAALRKFVSATGEAFECTAQLTHVPGEPALINDSELSQFFESVAPRAELQPAPIMRSLGADDFSFYGDLVPSLMCFVGVGETGTPSLHDARFLPPESAIFFTARALIVGYIAAAQSLSMSSSGTDE